MKRTLKTIIIGCAIAGAIAIPAYAQGPTGNRLASWEQRCLTSRTCRAYAVYSYDNNRWIAGSLNYGYRSVVNFGTNVITPRWAKR